MAGLSILNTSGHTQLDWNPTAVAEGDPEATNAVRAAKRILAEHLMQGATAFVVREGGLAKRTGRIDPNEDTVIVPRMVGG